MYYSMKELNGWNEKVHSIGHWVVFVNTLTESRELVFMWIMWIASRNTEKIEKNMKALVEISLRTISDLD